MREAWLVIAVLMPVACALIMGIPACRHWRAWRRRRDIMRCFLRGIAEGQLRVKHRRNKQVFGKGFIDSYGGTSGVIHFRLEATIEPFRGFHGVTLGIFSRTDAQGQPVYERWYAEWRSEGQGRPVGRIYEAVRAVCRKDRSLIEAS